MKTVRLSSQLARDIRREAERKYSSTNPEKEYPNDGMKFYIDNGYQTKVDATAKHFKETWGYDCPVNEIDTIHITADLDPDETEYNEYNHRQTFRLPISGVSVPTILVKYSDEMYVNVERDNPTFQECMEVKMYNDNLSTKKREYESKIQEVISRFSTLNQLLKAAPYIKNLVPNDRLQKMYEKDDRTARRKEQAELADTELAELREVLLEDSLLGDD